MPGDHEMRALSRDVANAMSAFSRVARARPLYTTRNKVIDGMMSNLVHAFDALFKMVPEISLKIRPDAFVFEEDTVLEEGDVEESIPFVFYREGVRRIDFVRGIEQREFEVLLDATAKGFNYQGMEDDLVSFLWHQELPNIRYLTVDVAVVDAETADVDIDQQIQALLQAIYGDSEDDVGPKSIHLDGSDVTAKKLADALDGVDEMAPGFHPMRSFLTAPAYAERLGEAAELPEDETLKQATAAALDAFASDIDSSDAALTGISLLRTFDAAVIDHDFETIMNIVRGVRDAEPAPRAQTWLTEALNEARVRTLASTVPSGDEAEARVLRILERAGGASVPSILSALPMFPDPTQRRKFSDLAIRLGINDREHLHELLQNDQGFVAREALYILSHIGHLEDLYAVRQVQVHPKPQVRMALLDLINKMPLDLAESVAIALLEDEEPRVRVAASESLVELGSERASAAITNMIEQSSFGSQNASVKAGFLRAYIRLNHATTLQVVRAILESADRRLGGNTEDAVIAVQALSAVPNRQTIDLLKEACLSKNSKVRDTARRLLEGLKGAVE